MLKNTLTGLKYKFVNLFAASFDDDDGETLYGWYDAILEGN